MGREREAREERTEHRGGKGGADGDAALRREEQGASRGNKEPARSERGAEAPGGRGPEAAGRPGCLIFCQPPLINGPPSSSERAEPRSSGNPARSFLAEAGLRKRLHLHKVSGSAA